MEQGRLRREEFMEHIVETTRDLVERVKRGTLADDTISTLTVKCPKDGGTVNENYKKFQCASCDFAIWKVIAGRRIENEEVEQLIRDGAIGPLQGFRSRIGRPFAAMLKLRDDFTAQLDFGQSGQDERNAAPVDFSGKTPLGPCPKCGARIFDHELAYVCERSVGPERTCDFRSGKVILQRAIEPEQMVKLLATGRTDLLHRFISKKGRPFSAFLVRQPDGKVGFEFAPRPAKKAAAGAPAPAPKPAAPRARDVAIERNVYELKPPKARQAPVKPPAKRAAAPAARVAAKRAAPTKKAARKVTTRRKPPAKKRAA
jgi:DNA topoisomerase-3